MPLVSEIDFGTPASKAEKRVTLAIDGFAVTVPEGTSIMRAAMEAGIKVPKLCAYDMVEAFGSCRLCLVEIEGRAGTPASCTTPVAEGMIVHTQSQHVAKLRRNVMELYISDHPLDCLTCSANGNCELQDMAGAVGLREGQAQFCYATNYLVDVKHAVIVDVEASTAVRQAEVTAAKRMIERAADDLGLWPRKLIADTGYGSAEMLGWLVHERGIEPHVPVFDKSTRQDGTFSRADFTYNRERDLYRCPGGNALTTSGTLVNDGATLLYRASKVDCDACALRPQCCPNEPARKIPRSVHEGARDMARRLPEEDEWLVSRRERKKVEMLFAHLKRVLRLDRLRLRGPNGARDVPPRSRRPEPQETGETDLRPAANDGDLSEVNKTVVLSRGSVEPSAKIPARTSSTQSADCGRTAYGTTGCRSRSSTPARCHLWAAHSCRPPMSRQWRITTLFGMSDLAKSPK
jgi:hypothetical protein